MLQKLAPISFAFCFLFALLAATESRAVCAVFIPVTCAVDEICTATTTCQNVTYCTQCDPDPNAGNNGGTGGVGPAVPEPTSALLFAAGIAVAALSTKVMRRK